MRHFNKLNFIFLAMTLILAPLAPKAHAATPKWTGIHVGVLGGTAAGNYNLHEAVTGSSEDLNASFAGGRLGLQGGVDANFRGLVVGALVDWSASNAKFKFDSTVSGVGTEEIHSTVKQMTTIRARVGQAHNHVLPYVHAGLVIADTELKVSGAGIPATVLESGMHPGFVVGAGFEYFVARRYSVATEYGFNHLNGINPTQGAFGGSGVADTEHIHYHTLTVVFNYHF